MKYRYFSPETDPVLFFCQETGEQGIRPEFVLMLDKLREACGFPFVVNSGYRSPNHSIEAAKEKPGEHAKGHAADIKVIGGNRRFLVQKHAFRLGFTGIGVAETYIHLDTRTGLPVSWIYK